MQIIIDATVEASDIAEHAAEDAGLLAEILDEMNDYFGDDERDKAWLADFAGRINESGRKLLRSLAAQIEGGK